MTAVAGVSSPILKQAFLPQACRIILLRAMPYRKACKSILPGTMPYRKACKIILLGTKPYHKACKIVLPSAKPYRKPCRTFLPRAIPYRTPCNIVLLPYQSRDYVKSHDNYDISSAADIMIPHKEVVASNQIGRAGTEQIQPGHILFMVFFKLA